MLQKSNKRAARAAVAAAKKLAEAAAKAVKELISALASLGGGTALFIVFSIVIVAGAFLASPLGILFADEQKSDDTVPLATAIAEIQGEYHAELERLQNGDFVSVQIVGQAPDWREVVSVFASKTAGAEDGIDVFTLDEERVELLRQVFWDMCEITTATQNVDVPDSDPDDDVDDNHTGIALTITITAKTAEQMRLIYAFTKYQNDALDILLENLGSLNIPMGSLTISQESAAMAQSNRKFYRDNGAAAYDVYAWNDQAARQYEDGRAYERSRQYELPEEQVREQPYRRVKSRTAIAPFTLVGMLTVACLMILVIFGYVQLFEASSSVSKLENQLANLKEQQLMLQSKYDAKIDLAAAEAHAAEIGLTKCQPEQIVYVSFSGTDQAEIYTQQRTSVFGEILDAMQQSIFGLIEYLHPTA